MGQVQLRPELGQLKEIPEDRSIHELPLCGRHCQVREKSFPELSLRRTSCLQGLRVRNCKRQRYCICVKSCPCFMKHGRSSLVGMFASPRPGCRKTHGKLMIPASTTYLAAIASLRLSERIGSSDRWRKLAETSGAARLHGLRLRVLKVTLSRRIYAVTRRADARDARFALQPIGEDERCALSHDRGPSGLRTRASGGSYSSGSTTIREEAAATRAA